MHTQELLASLKSNSETHENTQYIASHHLVDDISHLSLFRSLFPPIFSVFISTIQIVFSLTNSKIFLLRQKNIRVGCRVLAHFIKPLLLLRLENIHRFSISHSVSFRDIYCIIYTHMHTHTHYLSLTHLLSLFHTHINSWLKYSALFIHFVVIFSLSLIKIVYACMTELIRKNITKCQVIFKHNLGMTYVTFSLYMLYDRECFKIEFAFLT